MQERVVVEVANRPRRGAEQGVVVEKPCWAEDPERPTVGRSAVDEASDLLETIPRRRDECIRRDVGEAGRRRHHRLAAPHGAVRRAGRLRGFDRHDLGTDALYDKARTGTNAKGGQGFFDILKGAGVPVRVYGARESTHNKINANLGLSDDPGTKALFEFVDGALKK